jgi:lysophospholipase L1-like esterase
LYDLYKTEHADVVMLGNSLTQWVDWNELLGRKNIANHGIAGDVTSGYVHRLEYVYKLKPKLCFIEGGINDIYANVPVDVVYENYKKIVEELRSHSITPIIQSTLFVSPKWHDAVEKNKEVASLNSLLEEFAKKNNIEFSNLNARMSSNNMLRDELTHDGVHLTAAGYKIWGEEVERVVQKYGL